MNKSKLQSMSMKVNMTNKITGDKYTGIIHSEEEIDGRLYWVFTPDNRPGSVFRMAKDSYNIVKNKK